MPPGSTRVRPRAAFPALLAAAALSLLLLPASGEAAEATAVFSPTSQNFMPTVVGQRSAQQFFELRNAGPESIPVSGVDISGADSSEFSVENTTCNGANLGPSESCWAYVAFAPTHGGAREATLRATHDGEGSPTTAALSGNGLRQELTVSPAPLEFPATTKNMSSEAELTVSNKSEVGVAIWGTNFEGPGAGAFNITGSSCSGTLMVGASCKIDVRFNPQSEGEQSASLHISAEGPSGGTTVALAGLGADPQLQFEPESFDFGLTQTNEGGEGTRMVLRNVGPSTSQVGIETSGGSGAFSIGESDCWNATLAPLGTCSVQVNFRPNQTGAYAGVLRANSDGMNFDAPLTGSGGQAELSATPSPLDFGTTALGSRSEPRTVTIENSGTLPGSFFIAIIAGGDSASFQLVEEDCTGLPISAGGKCHAVVRFQPTAAGLRHATLSMFGNGEGGQQIALSGNGVGPAVPAAIPSSRSFGTEQVGMTGGAQLFTFTNEGSVATEVAGMALGGEDSDQFRFARDNCSETSLAPGASCQVGIRFAPSEAGVKGATLRLKSSSGVSTAALSGYAEGVGGTAAAPTSMKRLRVALRLAGRPLRISGPVLHVGAFTCASEKTCQVVARATIVKARGFSAAPGVTTSIGPWSTKLTVPPGVSRNLVLRLPVAARSAARSGRLRLRWESRSGSQRSQDSAEVSLR